MKVLFISHYYHPHVGGVEKHVSNISRELINKGHTVTVLTEKYKRGLPDKFHEDGVEVIRFSYPKIRFFGLFYIWLFFIKNVFWFRKFDIIHCHDVFIWYFPISLILRKKRVYITFHGWEGKYPVPKVNILLNKLAATLTRGNLCAGKFIEKYYFIKADKVYYTAVDLPDLSRLNKNSRRIIYVGRLDKDTGLDKILKALDYLKGFTIEFCGDGPLAEKCSKYGKVHGFVDPIPYLKRSLICLSPGLTSILESFSTKCLVVTTYNNPLKRDYLLMTPFKEWIVVKSTPRKVAEMIEYYSKDPSRARKRISLAYKWVKTQTWNNLVKEYLDLWEK